MELLRRKLIILNEYGQRLSALLYRAKVAAAAGASPPEGCGPIIVVCHGFTGSKEGGGRALEMGEALAAKGYSCLLFDFAGCGESEGLWEEISLSRQLGDLGSVVQWCRAAGFSKIILNGRSFGGATALCYGAADKQIAGICAWSAPAHPDQLFRKFAGGAVAGPAAEMVELAGDGGAVRLLKGFFYDLEKHDLLNCTSQIAPRPLLLIHGTADEVVPSGDALQIEAAAGEPKKLALIEGADHRFSAHMDGVWRNFFAWLKLYF